MTERCSGDWGFDTAVVFKKISKVFKMAIEVFTLGEIHTVRKDGVYILNKGRARLVRIKGQCPHFIKGECAHGLHCPIDELVDE